MRLPPTPCRVCFRPCVFKGRLWALSQAPFFAAPKLDSRLTLAAAPRPPGRLLAASEPPGRFRASTA